MNKGSWRKSSYSGGSGGNCVEVADHGNRVLVRDTKNSTGAMLRFTHDAWQRFADRVKRSLASDPGRRCRGHSHVSRLRVALRMPSVGPVVRRKQDNLTSHRVIVH
ncbi:MAG TPA: DUF397 domain-containing protein [Streptosporangiaceae bacterium]